jgi:hypothetical protein
MTGEVQLWRRDWLECWCVGVVIDVLCDHSITGSESV